MWFEGGCLVGALLMISRDLSHSLLLQWLGKGTKSLPSLPFHLDKLSFELPRFLSFFSHLQYLFFQFVCQEPFDPEEFVERLAWRTVDSNREDGNGTFDPVLMHETFSSAIKYVLLII